MADDRDTRTRRIAALERIITAARRRLQYERREEAENLEHLDFQLDRLVDDYAK